MAAPETPSDPDDGSQDAPGSAIGARVDLDPDTDTEPARPADRGPEPTREPSGPPVASFWRRLGAYLVDGVVLFVVNALVTRLTIGPPPSGIDPLAPGSLETLWPYYALNGLVAWLYFAGLESSTWQATLGKRVLGLEVTDELGEPISFPRATGRYFGKLLSAIPLGLGFLWIFVSRENQAWHDTLAGCLVLHPTPDTRNIEGLEPDSGP